jgi:phosphocarrier protein HPr
MTHQRRVMKKGSVKIINPLGLHARATASLVRVASKFKSKVTISRLDKAISADAKSILSVLTLAANKGTGLELMVEGTDEIEAFEAVKTLFEQGFGEI